MGRNWKILKAAVEQEVLFPNQSCFDTYIKRMEQKNRSCEVLSTIRNQDGSLTVLMRKGYNPGNAFLSEAERMLLRTNNELRAGDIDIDPDMLVDDEGRNIIAYIETWFDVDQKFGTNTEDNDTLLSVYAFYDPYEDTLRIECVINGVDQEERCFGYTPTENEASLIKSMIAEKTQKRWNMTPQEYCEDAVQTLRKL